MLAEDRKLYNPANYNKRPLCSLTRNVEHNFYKKGVSSTQTRKAADCLSIAVTLSGVTYSDRDEKNGLQDFCTVLWVLENSEAFLMRQAKKLRKLKMILIIKYSCKDVVFFLVFHLIYCTTETYAFNGIYNLVLNLFL